MNQYCRNLDQEAFDAWFDRAFPKPRSRAQRSNWEYKRRCAYLGWRAARLIPEPELPKNSLTSAVITPLTPADMISAFPDAPYPHPLD